MACHFHHERELREAGWHRVAGVDEAGRGALAGPVVAAAVILPPDFHLECLDDSKKLSRSQRELCYEALTTSPEVSWSVGVVEAPQIDRINILRASHEAMRIAVSGLPGRCDFALIDGLPVQPFPVPFRAIVGGDGICKSIAAASVIAKVSRDAVMRGLEALHPEYCFAQHKGYATALHLAMLREHGPCAIHRMSFEPVAQRTFAF